MQQANEAIKCERFPILIIEEMLLDMNGSKVFSKLDLKWGFHQFNLSEELQLITTFATCMGLYQYKKLMPGMTSMSEICQYTIQSMLSNCEGAQNMTDNIIICANSVKEHDRQL